MRPNYTVLNSINADGGARCVDIFERPDGSFGFDEFRRDAEDTRGWYSIGYFGARTFSTQKAAMKAALATVAWLQSATVGDQNDIQ